MKFKQKINLFFTKFELIKFYLLFVGIVIMGFLEVIGITSVVPFIAVVVSPELVYENIYLFQIYTFFNFQKVNDFIFFLGVALIVALLVSNAFQAFMTWCITYFTNAQGSRLAVRLLKKYLMQPYGFFLDRNTSDLGNNILFEVHRVTRGVFMQSVLVLSKLVMAFFIFLVLVFANPLIAFLGAIFFGGTYAIIFISVKQKLQNLGKATTKDNFELLKSGNEAMSGIKDIKLRGSENEFVSCFSLPSINIAKYMAKKTLITSLPRYLLEVVAFGGIVAIVITTLTINEGVFNSIIPLISLYVLASYRLMPAFQQIYTGISSIKFDFSAFENLVKEFSIQNNENQNQVNTSPVLFKEKLKIDKLDFTYDNSEIPVLNNLDLTIYPKTIVGIVGLTGSGKTTLVDIILGLLVPKSGEISSDGIKLNHSNRSAWQKNIGYVPQSIFLIDDTIIANIAFAVPNSDISIDRAIKAAKMANLDKFISTLPEQYNTVVGERGVRLSGGQRQRIGIARALYYNPEILVLDEATSSLDGITEEIIIDSITSLSNKITIIMIAHRLSTVKRCDVIHMMANGKVINSGSYHHLMTHSVEFRKMAKNSYITNKDKVTL